MKNFYLTVYAYHLCLTLSDNLYGFKEDASYLWESLVSLGKTNTLLPFEGLKNLKSHLRCYDNSNKFSNQELEGLLTKNQTTLDLGSISGIDFQIEGKLAPFLLNDTYAIDLTLWAESPEKTEVDVPN
jgi:hypothetical protein